MVVFALIPIPAVPEFSVAKDGDSLFSKNEIGFSWKIPGIFAVTKAVRPKQPPQNSFDGGVSGFVGLHVAFTLFGSQFVHIN